MPSTLPSAETHPGQRAISLVIALALQIAFLLLVIQAIESARPGLPQRIGREMTMVLPRLSTAAPPRLALPMRPHVHSPIRPQVTAPIILPPPGAPSAIPGVPPSSLQDFGQALNDCAPENYANLPAEQKARCTRPGAGVAIREAPNLMGTPSQVKDEARWEEELARKQSPGLLPCNGFLNVACLLGKIADGTWTDYGDPRAWPRYAVKQLSPEDFYRIEKEYDSWHAAHAKAPTK